jgi:hypothetical protein
MDKVEIELETTDCAGPDRLSQDPDGHPVLSRWQRPLSMKLSVIVVFPRAFSQGPVSG